MSETILAFGSGAEVHGLPEGVSTPAQDPPPAQEFAITDRISRIKPATPVWGARNSIITDVTFGSRILRVTDGTVLAGNVNSSHASPSASHQLAWSKNGTYLYTLGVYKCIPWTFNPTTMQAARIPWPGAGTARINDNGLILNSVALEPQFSWVDDRILYFNNQTGNWPVVASYNLATHAVVNLLDLNTIPNLTLAPQAWWYGGTVGYLGAIYSSESTEKINVFFGGDAQDHHYLAGVFSPSTPSQCVVIDTKNSLIYINGAVGVPTSITLNFLLHHSQIDRSGRYITLEPTGGDIALGKAPKYIVDLNDYSIVPLAPYPLAHTVMGFIDFINGDFVPGTPYDNAQWSIRELADIAHPRNLIKDPQAVGETYVDGHTSWNNALAASLKPVLTEIYRAYDGPNDVSPKNTVPWRAWDDEIISIETDGLGTGTTVWRHCHHRSIVRDDIDTAGAQPFYYQPRPNISPDGKWALFTSNWDRTLGTDSSPQGANITKRYDAFIVELRMP